MQQLIEIQTLSIHEYFNNQTKWLKITAESHFILVIQEIKSNQTLLLLNFQELTHLTSDIKRLSNSQWYYVTRVFANTAALPEE